MKNKLEISKEIRRNIVKMVYTAKSGHPGGSLSAVEILVSLYFGEMNIDPAEPDKEERDRFVLSKGHITPAYYSVLAAWLFSKGGTFYVSANGFQTSGASVHAALPGN